MPLPFRLRTIPLLACGLGVAFWIGQRSAGGAGWLFLASFIFSWWLVPYAADAARSLKALSYPGGRSINERVTPLLGGLAVFVPLLLALLDTAFRYSDTGPGSKAMGIALGATVMFVLGAIDDTRGVSPRWKILAQLAAGGWLVLSGFRLETLTLPGLAAPIHLGFMEVPFILFWVVLITNAMNLIDGMDGLASTVALLAALGAFAIGAQPAAALVLAGTCLGFLRHNLPRATIFLGDSGSLVLGFALAAFTLDLPASQNVPLMIALVCYPLADTTLAVLRRFLRGKPLFAPDRGHIHHKLLQHFGSAPRALAAAAVLVAIPLWLGLSRPGIVSVALTALMWAVVAGLMVWAGRSEVARLFLVRRPIQRLYAVNQYAKAMIGLAESRADLRRVLRHVCAQMGVTDLEIDGWAVVRARKDLAQGPEEAIRLPGGCLASWRVVPFEHDRVLSEERQSLMTERVRQAHGTLLALGGPEPSPARPQAV